MTRLSLGLCAALLAGTSALSPTAVEAAGTQFLMWQLPASGIEFPVYVYSGGRQTDYLYGTAQQAFIGAYAAGATAGTYRLYYKSGKHWRGCTLVLANGAVSPSPATTCPGAVINPPAATSNVYTVAFGASAWPIAKAPTPTPVSPDYAKRKITFVNRTRYPMIQIGEVCTVSANPGNAKCANRSNLFRIARGASRDFTVGAAALSSYGFSMTAYQLPPDKRGRPGAIVQTGGYGSGNPYATKIEFTSLAVDTSNGAPIPQGATNFDISAVDGYNVSVRGYPATSTYCTYTVPPENSNVLGAGLYDRSRPLARISASAAVCAASSQLPTAGGGGAWPLTVSDGAGHFQGCMSPCTYATATANAQAPLYCCSGGYASPATCDQPPGQPGANTSTYVSNLATATTNVYRFAYDDAIGDFACPASTDFVIEFTSD